MRNIYFEKYTLETTCKINVACEEALGGVARIHARAATHAQWTEKEILFLRHSRLVSPAIDGELAHRLDQLVVSPSENYYLRLIWSLENSEKVVALFC